MSVPVSTGYMASFMSVSSVIHITMYIHASPLISPWTQSCRLIQNTYKHRSLHNFAIMLKLWPATWGTDTIMEWLCIHRNQQSSVQ